jgi:predicted TIM-barrel fold metal-dependent hydrolase
MADWCARFPERRAGIGQIFLNDVDQAMEDVRWIKEHNLRGGVLISAIPPDCKHVKPLYDPVYEPLWALCEELEVPVNAHGGTGGPDYGKYPVAALLFITEVAFYSQRPFAQLLLSGVFERHPRLKFVMTEMGCAWLVPMLRHFDRVLAQIRKAGAIGEMRYTDEHILPRSATEYFHQNCWVGISQPGPDDVRARKVLGVDRLMWGSDYPHDEGTYPFTREHLRQLFADTSPDELQQVLGENAARLYDFDLRALAPLAEKIGPTVEEIAQPLTALPDNPNEALLKGVPATA